MHVENRPITSDVSDRTWLPDMTIMNGKAVIIDQSGKPVMQADSTVNLSEMR